MAGCAPHIGWLILGRFLQGVGAAIVLPLAPSLLPEAFPEQERGKAIAWLGSLGGIALALGPMLGGVIVTYLNWHWIFFINVPIIILGYLFSFKTVKEPVINCSKVKLDGLGMLFFSLTRSGVVMRLINSQQASWTHWLTLTYLAIGLVSGALLFSVEQKRNDALIDFRDFSNAMFYAGGVLCFSAGVLSAVALFLILYIYK